MKKNLLIAVLLISTTATYAQEGLRLGVKASYSSTWFFNKNVSDRNASLDYASSFSTSFAGQVIWMLSETYGVSMEVNYAGHNQKYDGYFKDDLTNKEIDFTNEINTSYIDIPLMFRVSSPRGPYFDIGPQVSLLTGAKETFDVPGYTSPDFYTDKDFKDNFEGFGLGAVLGFGVDIRLTDNLNLTTGLRFGYMFTDATVEYTLAEADALSASKKLSQVSRYAHTNTNDNFEYSSTNRTYGGLQIGLQYKLGQGK